MTAHDEKVPGVLRRLGTLTCIRNTDLLEHSLVKTLTALLGVTDAVLCRFDRNTPMRVVGQWPVGVLADDGALAPDGDGATETPIPPDVQHVAEQARQHRRPWTGRRNDLLLIAYPLVVDQVIAGCFVFERDSEPTVTEDGILRGVLEVFSNYYQLLDASQRDRLTGLLNRHALEDRFEKIVAELTASDEEWSAQHGEERRRSPRSYWAAVIDIDRFKGINDRFGHIIGDEVLLLVARLMEGTLRRGDALFRYGGEEFVALYAAASDVAAMEGLDRLRRAVEAHDFPQVRNVTISAGLARVDPRAAPEVVIGNADRALYYSKENGRNRVSCYDHLVETGEFEEVKSGDLELF